MLRRADRHFGPSGPGTVPSKAAFETEPKEGETQQLMPGRDAAPKISSTTIDNISDAAAHCGALDAGGRTIAVLGTGIDQTFPPANRQLRNRIAQRGTIISQFTHGQLPSKTSFPVRNVLIAGLSRVSVLVELTEHSGTRIEATVALEQGKQVLLWAPLLEHEGWAQRFADHPMVEFVASVEEIEAQLARLR